MKKEIAFEGKNKLYHTQFPGQDMMKQMTTQFIMRLDFSVKTQRETLGCSRGKVTSKLIT